MQTPYVLSSLILVSQILILGCSTAANEKLDQKLTLEPAVLDISSLHTEAQTGINQDQTLNLKQKEKLTTLLNQTTYELKMLRYQSLQLRGVLAQDYQNKDDAEIDLIHDRLIENSKKQVSVLFDSINKANQIEGRIFRNQVWMDFMENREGL